MQNRRQTRRNKARAKKDIRHVRKTFFQTVVAFVLMLVVWSVSLSKQPVIKKFCDKIRHCLTYTVDVRSVFRPLIETNNSGDNENAH